MKKFANGSQMGRYLFLHVISKILKIPILQLILDSDFDSFDLLKAYFSMKPAKKSLDSLAGK